MLLEVAVAEDGFAQGFVEGFGGLGAEVFAVEPLELGEVEDGAAEADVFDVEVLEHILKGEDIGVWICSDLPVQKSLTLLGR